MARKKGRNRTETGGGKKTGKAAGKAKGPGNKASPANRPMGASAATDQSLEIPSWAPALLFVLATVVLFGKFIFSREMLFGHDTLGLGYMARAFFAERLAQGDFPLWSPRLLGGIPSIEALAAGDAIYPTSLLYLIMEPYRALGWKLVLHVLAGGFFMFGWIRALGLTRASAMLAGLGWVLAPVIVTLVLPGNDGKLMVASLAPLVFWATERLLQRPDPRTVAAVAFAVGVTSLTTQFQTAYFLFLSVGVFAAVRIAFEWKEGRGEVEQGPGPARLVAKAALFLMAAVLGAGIAAVQMLPAGEYVRESSRRTATTVEATAEEARAYASSWSLHPEEVAGLVVPEFGGNTSAGAPWAQGTYWGRNFFKYNHEYAGVTILLLAGLSLVGRRKQGGTRWFMAGMGVVWLLFALGAHTPVWRIFYELVPGISIFRVPSLSAFLVSFAATTLFAFTVDDLLTEDGRPDFLTSKRGRLMLGLVGALLLGLVLQATGLLPRIWTALLFSDIDERRSQILANAAPFITRGFMTAFLLAAAAGAAVWAVTTGRITRMVFVAAMVLIVAVDLGRIDRPFIQTFDFASWSRADDNVRFLQSRLGQEGPFRVADLRNAQNVDLAMHDLDLVAGHHPNDLARYRTLLDLQGSQSVGGNIRHPVVLRMLNTKYFVWPETAEGGPPSADAVPLSQVQTRAGIESVYPYPGLDRAWMVRDFRVMDDDAALTEMLNNPFNPSEQMILAEDPAGHTPPRVEGPLVSTVSWSSFEPDERRGEVETSVPGFLVISENWFPGWQVEVDGAPVPLLRANLTLGAVPIMTAGRHEVVLRYTAPRVRRALMITLLSLVVASGLALAPVVPQLRKRPTPNHPQTPD
ncbi:MAG: hypothetical protein ACR2QM_05170 [Longimicrobiales bacterium]